MAEAADSADASASGIDDTHDDLLTVTFELIAERGWRGLAMADVASRSGQPLAAVYEAFPTPGHIFSRLGRKLDRAMLGGDPLELAELEPRERLFELFMRRFDALSPYRAGFKRLGIEAACEPSVMRKACGNLNRMGRWMVQAGGISGSPLQRALAARALIILYGRVFRVWLRDDTPDHARTLAELDKGLSRLASFGRFGDRFRNRGARGATAAAGA